MERNAIITLDKFDAGKCPNKVVMPERSTVLAIGDRRKPDAFLHSDRSLDGIVLDGAQRVRGRKPIRSHRALEISVSCSSNVARSQQATDMIGTIWRFRRQRITPCQYRGAEIIQRLKRCSKLRHRRNWNHFDTSSSDPQKAASKPARTRMTRH